MGTRPQLQTILENLMGDDPNVYFQTPVNFEIKYPCIIYALDDLQSEFADNRPYARIKGYQVTVIDRNPDSELPDKVEELPYCSFDRYFSADSLNHYVFTLFF